MSDPATPAVPAKRSSLGRKLLFAGIALAILLVICFFAATSSAFLKAVVLPRVGTGIGATITAAEVSLSPFSQLILRQAQVQTTGTEPLFAAQEIRVRYHLWDLIGGNVRLDEVTLNAPKVVLVQNADGTSNLDPILAALNSQKKPKRPKPPKEAKPLQLDVRNVALNQATVRLVQNQKSGGRQVTELANFQLAVDAVKNAQAGKMTLGADAEFEQAATNNGPANQAQAKLAGTCDFTLDAGLLPKSIKGSLQFTVGKTAGTFAELEALAGALDWDVTPTELRQFALQFSQAGQKLGQVRLSGPIDIAKTEGHLKLEVLSVDRHVLNLVGAARGWDFGGSILNASSELEITQNASVISASGQLAGRQLSVKQNNLLTPALDLDVDYQFNLNLTAKTALIQKFTVLGKQGANELLRATMAQPINLSWGATLGGVPDSAWQLQVTNLNLGDWQPLLGGNVPAGKVNLQLKLLAQEAGHRLKTDLAAQIQDLAATVGTNKIAIGEVRAQLTSQIDEFKKITLSQFQIEAKQPDRTLVSANGSANYDLDTHELGAQATVEASAPAALQLFPMPPAAASAGTVKLTAQLAMKGQTLSSAGHVQLADFTGGYGDYQFRNFQPSLDYDVAITGNQVQITRGVVVLSHGAGAEGHCEVSGQYDLGKKSGRVDFKLADVNQNTLAPLVATKLAPARLAAVTISAAGSASYDPQGDAALTADVNVADLLLNDPRNQWPSVPLNSRLQVDGSLRGQLVAVKKFLLTLSTGGANGTAPQPGGELNFTGKYDLDKKTGQAEFKLADLNQNALGPFLGPRLAPNKLISVSLNASGSANYDPQRDSSVKAQIAVTNLLVEDPQHRLPPNPLGAQFQVDGALKQQVLDVRQLRIALAPTALAKNELNAQGKIDLSRTNAAAGQLSVTAESLDLTPFYDLLAGPSTTNAASRTTVAAPAQPPTAAANAEPAPVKLPFQDFTLDLSVGRLYLRELAITNLTATAKLNPDEVTVKPFQLTLNGAAVTASVVANLGVPGYRYDLSLKADKIPLAPLANSFSPTYSGQAQGDLFADVQLKGAGITGANLRRNLAGQCNLSLTNADIQLVSPKMNILLVPIASLLRVSEITQSPLNAIYARIAAGNGEIRLDQAGVESAAFQASTRGTITIADVLTNSPINHLPVDFYLNRAIAGRAHLIMAGTPTNATFVKLPNFLKIGGTLGTPKTQTDDIVITALIAGSAAGFVGGKAGNILQGVGGILSGGRQMFTNPQTNSAPDTNQPPKIINPLNILNNLFKK
ncbi:MAG: DUF748 domain-containing protein [Limisphaerales bacterium]